MPNPPLPAPMAPLSLEQIAAALVPPLVRRLLQVPSPEQEQSLSADVRLQIPAARDREVWRGRYRTEAAMAHFASDPSGGPYGIGLTARDLADVQRFLLRGIAGAAVIAGRPCHLAIDLPLILLLASGYGWPAPGPASRDDHFVEFEVLDEAGDRGGHGLIRPGELAELPTQLGSAAGQASLSRALTIRILTQLAEREQASGPLLHPGAGANRLIRQAVDLLIEAADAYYGHGRFLVNRQLLEQLPLRPPP